MTNRKLWCTALVLVIPGVACGGDATRKIFETSLSAPVTPDQPYVLVSVAGPITRPENINRIAVSGDYLFFASINNGVYRMPKYGGDLSTVDEDRHGSFMQLDANTTDVFWDHTTFDGNHSPHLGLRRCPVSGGPMVTMLEEDGSIPAAENPSLRVDGQAAFLITTRGDTCDAALRRVPVDGSPPKVLMTDTSLCSTSWAMDDDYLYFDTKPPVEAGATSTLTRMPKTGGTIETIGQSLPSNISTADDQFVYGMGLSYDDPQNIVYVMGFSKTGVGPPLVVAPVDQNDAATSQSTLVDGTSFYFATQFQLWRVGAPGETPQRIGPHFPEQIDQLVEDAQNLFILYGYHAVALVSKTAVASP